MRDRDTSNSDGWTIPASSSTRVSTPTTTDSPRKSRPHCTLQAGYVWRHNLAKACCLLIIGLVVVVVGSCFLVWVLCIHLCYFNVYVFSTFILFKVSTTLCCEMNFEYDSPEQAARRRRLRVTSKQVFFVTSSLYAASVASFSATSRFTMRQKIDSSIPVRTTFVASSWGNSIRER